jgi:hypothetical protein
VILEFFHGCRWLSGGRLRQHCYNHAEEMLQLRDKTILSRLCEG